MDIKEVYTLIGVLKLMLMIFAFSFDKEWYITIGLLEYIPDITLMKTVHQIVQNTQFTSILCVFISVALNSRYTFLKLLAIKIYLLCQFVSMICFVAAAVLLLNRSSYAIYQEWQRINMAVAGVIYFMCFCAEFVFIFVAGKYHVHVNT